MRFFLASLVATVLYLAPVPVGAVSIGFSNESFRSWNGVIVHPPGFPFSYFVVNQTVESAGPEAALSHDLGFARVAAVSRSLSLHPSSAVDARNLSVQGYDYAIAEATTSYEGDFVVTGGTGTVDILIELSELVSTFTNEPGFALTSLRSVWLDGPNLQIGLTPGEWLRASLEFDAPYHVSMSLTAYSRATLGRRTSHARDLELTLTVVPEPATGSLLALGLALLRAQRFRNFGSRFAARAAFSSA